MFTKLTSGSNTIYDAKRAACTLNQVIVKTIIIVLHNRSQQTELFIDESAFIVCYSRKKVIDKNKQTDKIVLC